MRAWVELRTTDPVLDHCTLAYFGEVGAWRMHRIRSEFSWFCETVNYRFSVPITGTALFGHEGRTPVLLLGNQDGLEFISSGLQRLVRSEFPFRPHITVPDFEYIPDKVTFKSAVLKTADRWDLR